MLTKESKVKEEVVARDDIFWKELSAFLTGCDIWKYIFSIDGSVKRNVSLDTMQKAFSIEIQGRCFRHHLLGDFSEKARKDYQLVLLENYMLQMRRLNDADVDVLPLLSHEKGRGGYARAVKSDSFLSVVSKWPARNMTPTIELRIRRLARGFIEFDVLNRVAASASVKNGMLECIMRLPDDERLAALQSIFDVTGNAMAKMMFLPEKLGDNVQPSISQKDSSLHEPYNAYYTMKKQVMSKAKFVEISELKSVLPIVMPDRKKEAKDLTALRVFEEVCKKETVDRLFVACVRDEYKPEILSAYFSLLLDLRGNGAPRHALFDKGSPMAHLAYRLFENPKHEKPLKHFLSFVETLYQEKILGPSQGMDSLVFFLQGLFVRYMRSFPRSRIACFSLFVSLYQSGLISDIDSEILTNSLPRLTSAKTEEARQEMLQYLLLYFQLPTTYPERTSYCLEWTQDLFAEIQRQKPAEKAQLIQMMLSPKTPLGSYFEMAKHYDPSVLKKARTEYAVMLADHHLKKASAGGVAAKALLDVSAIKPYFLEFYKDMPELAKEFESEEVMMESGALKHLETISLTHHENIGYFILSKILARDELDLAPVQAYFDLLVKVNARKGDEVLSARVKNLVTGNGFCLPGSTSEKRFDLTLFRAIEHVLYYKPSGIKLGKDQLRVINKNKEQLIPLLRALMSLPIGDKLKGRLRISREKLFDVVSGMEPSVYLSEVFTEGSPLHAFFNSENDSVSFLKKKEEVVLTLIGDQPFKQIEQYADFLNEHCPEEKGESGSVVTMRSVLKRLETHKVMYSLIEQKENPIGQSLGVDKYSNLLFTLASSGFRYDQGLRSAVMTLARAIVVSDNWELKANNLIFLHRLVSHGLLESEDLSPLFTKPFKTSSKKLDSYTHFLLPNLLRDKGEGDRPEQMRAVFALAQLPLPSFLA